VPEILTTLRESRDEAVSLNLVRGLLDADKSIVADVDGIGTLVTIAGASTQHDLINACLDVLAGIARLCTQHRDNVIFSIGGLEKIVAVFILTKNINFLGAIGGGTPSPPYTIYGPTVIQTLLLDTRPAFEILKNMCDPQYGYAGRDRVCVTLEPLLDRTIRLDTTDDVLQIIDNLSISDNPAHVTAVTSRRAFLEVLVYYSQIEDVRDDVFRIASNIATSSTADLHIMKQILLEPARKVLWSNIDQVMKTEAILFMILCLTGDTSPTRIADASAMLHDVERNSPMIQAEIFCCIASIARDPMIRPMIRTEIECNSLLNKITDAQGSTDSVISTTARHCLCALTTYEI